MNIKVLFLSLIISHCLSCSKPKESLEMEEKITVTEKAIEKMPSPFQGITQSTRDNSMTSLDWAGTYFNTLPCEHCEGIETWVTLKTGGTFELKTNYLGLNDAREEIFTGSFSWDETGAIVSFKGLIGDYPGKFKVEENQIWYLDKAGNRIEGELADRYVLKKK